MRRETYRARSILVTAFLAGCAATTWSCGGDDDGSGATGGTGGVGGRSGADAGKDASSDANTGVGGSGGVIGTGGTSGAAGSSGSAGKSGAAGSGGTGGSAGAGDGGPRDATMDATGGAAGKGGTAGTGGVAGSGGTGGAAGSAGTGGAAGSGGSGGAIDGSTEGGGGVAGTDGGAGSDGGSPDVSDDTASDASDDVTGADTVADTGNGGDGSVFCAVDNTACSKAGGNGLCKSQVCASCVDGVPSGDAGNDGGASGDDTNCSTAYGGAYLCLSGVCTQGNCRVDGDCTGNAAGPLCGIAQSNFCGKCTTDAQCLAAGPSTPVCNTSSGVCIASASSCNGQADNTQCSINSADVCCGFACAPGECCPGAAGDTACKTKLSNSSARCSSGHECTLCDAPAGLTFIVDPLSGVDDGATGSGAAGGNANAACAFKTITKALQALGSTPAVGTVIRIRNTGPVSVAGNGETFPIEITANVTITATGGAVTVTPPAGVDGFDFASAGSGINGTLGGGTLVIDGATNTAGSGITATTGATDTTTVRNVTIQNFLRDGIQVVAGTLTIQEGVLVTGSGTTAAKRPGLHVTSSGHVNVTVPAGQATTAFNSNTQHGILVDGAGSVTITGSQSGGNGTIETRGNAVAGLAIAQTPAVGLPLNSVNGLLSVGTTAGNGIRIEGGSNVKVRNSYTLGNLTNGVIVITSVIGSTRNNVITDIDLGKAADPGHNQFQATIGSNSNISAGICFQMDASSGTLSAQGNIFSGGKNCANAAGVLTFSNAGCGSQRDLGLAVAKSGGATTGNDIDVTMCTHP